MAGIDGSKVFVPVNIAVLTVSDTRELDNDRSGDIIVTRIKDDGHTLVARAVVKDEFSEIVANLKKWIDDPSVDVVISTGGTGVTGRDVTPEAFETVFEKKIEGFGELFRWISFQKLGTSTIQSRATAGVAGGTYLFDETNWISGFAHAILSKLCLACGSTNTTVVPRDGVTSKVC